MRVFHQNERCLLALSFLHNLREDGGKKAALILMRNSHFGRPPQCVVCKPEAKSISIFSHLRLIDCISIFKPFFSVWEIFRQNAFDWVANSSTTFLSWTSKLILYQVQLICNYEMTGIIVRSFNPYTLLCQIIFKQNSLGTIIFFWT